MKVLNCKTLKKFEIMIKLLKTLANFVPAAAVIREGLALFKLIGRKGYVD